MQTKLFDSNPSDLVLNLLPKDGCAQYLPGLFDETQANALFEALEASLPWQPDHLKMFGQAVTTRRKVVWVGDPDCTYTYSGVLRHPQAWTPEILRVKAKLEAIASCQFNACLLNFYHDGKDGMGWHSDDEKELEYQSPIASLSLGSTRKFAFRHKQDKTTASLFLENGSLLLMHPPTQQFWHHALLKTTTVQTPRINLTFRKIRDVS
ncbi:Alkylated DNA repair dioxygenase AlkB [Polynucleobacter meluiroseus]|uniref:Alkylated DNA repair dioxygenase AlkB n=1 Tax=Polynucleobacter meluiroseus TaxID=1938814 RepID=A0A240DY14_9BURK|nr:alpha-ketoglutarate-dependent dioxygenase AlkB [Polynucleobacter meluiroseus]SNX28085.1 Alkylated DNA repair dioxygenase AlkB [Polynucleobacter meluiroseus]